MATIPTAYNQAEVAIGQLKDAGEIQGVFGTAHSSDEPHFHLPYLMMKILGYDVESVSMNVDDPRKVGHMAVNYVFPKSDKRTRPFELSMQGAGPEVFWFNIIGQKGNVSASMSELADILPGSSASWSTSRRRSKSARCTSRSTCSAGSSNAFRPPTIPRWSAMARR